MLSAIASCHGRKREYPLAIDYETRALNLREALGNQTDIADSLSALASFYVRTGNFSDAIACAKRALRIEREWGSQRGIGAALSTLATTLDMAGRSSETMPYLQESLTIKEAQGDRTAEIGTYLLMSLVNNKRGDPLAGLANLETARDLQDEVAGQIANPITSVDVRNSIAVYREYIWALMALHRKHPGYGYDRRAFLAADYERARYVTSVLQPSRLEDLASALDPNSVLIEYFIDSHSKGLIWLLTRARLVSLTFDRVSAVPELARAILEEMSRPGGGATPRSTARGELSRILLGPVAPYIKGMRLIIISDESFGFLPLGDLADPSREDGAPLIRDHQVAYLPAATVMVDTRNSRREVRTSRSKLMAVVADPIFERSDTRFKRRFHNYGEAVVQPKELTAATRSFGWTRDGTDYIPPLPFSRSEADAVTRTAPPGEVAEYLGFRASRTAVLRDLADYKIIHFATHGLINASAPELSGLLLSLWDPTGASQPGFLTISDIYDLGLQASLVTLSSCQTSLGQRISGYGVIGLTSAFLHAGARRVVSSSWKVDDEATAKLMTFFYRNLLTRRLDPADALRQAQLRLADSVRWRDPYYWAGWRLYGAQGPMRTEPTQPRR